MATRAIGAEWWNMIKAGEGQFRGTDTAADGLCRLQKQDGIELAAKGNRRRQTIRPRTHDNRIVIISLWHQGFPFRFRPVKTMKIFFST